MRASARCRMMTIGAKLGDAHQSSLCRAQRGEGGARNARRVGCLSEEGLSSAYLKAFNSIVEGFSAERPHPAAPRASTLPALRAAEGGSVVL